jgi:hypothetical protein
MNAKTIKWTLTLIMVAAFTNGLPTGGNIDRLLVATPAGERVGLDGWADFSRFADLGNGQFVYPLMALGSTALVVLAAILFISKDRSLRGPMLPIGLAAASMIVALPFSLKAVPFMMSLRDIHDGDVVALGRAFAGAHFWGRPQSYFHLTSFCAQMWAIVAWLVAVPKVQVPPHHRESPADRVRAGNGDYSSADPRFLVNRCPGHLMRGIKPTVSNHCRIVIFGAKRGPLRKRTIEYAKSAWTQN